MRRGSSLLVTAAMAFQLLGQALPVAAATTSPGTDQASPSPVVLDAPGTASIVLASGAGITSDGVPDPNVTYSIAGGATGQAVTVTPQASYGVPVAGSRWINTTGATGCDQACGAPGSPLATAYSMVFTLPPGFASPSLSISVLADDAATVLLNGHQVGQQPQNKGSKNYQNVGSFSTTSFFVVGTNTLTVSNIDYGGSNGVDFSATVTYSPDTTPPVASPTPAPAPNAAGWNKTDVEVFWNWADAGAGIDSTASNCPISSTTTGQFSPPGQTLVSVCTDRAGNTASKSYTVSGVDKTKPTISGSASPKPGASGWNNSDVTVSFTCSDDRSGIPSGSCPAPAKLTGEGGSQSVTGTVSDNAGNSESATVGGINIDKTAPLTTATPTSPNANGWNNTSVTVSLTATDPLSGVAATYYVLDPASGGTVQTGTSATIDGEGTHTLGFWSVDNAGNVEQSHTIQVKIDTTAPTVTSSSSPAPNGNGWNNTSVTVTFTCSDALSGIASCTPPQSVSTEGASQAVTGTATDNAGNSNTATALVSIDRTAPTVTGAPDRSGNSFGWYSDDVTVSFACHDDLSGIVLSGCTSPVTLGQGANQSVTGSATDAAGNTASTTVGGINVDKTPPTITAAATTSPTPLGFYTGPVTIHFTCSDALSGIPTDTCPVNQVLDVAGSTGTVTSTSVTVKDRAGNESAPSNVISVTIDKTPSATPLLVKAASGSNGGIAGLVQAVPGLTAYTVSLYLSPSCSSNVPGATQFLGTANVTLDTYGAGAFAINIAGLPAGQYITATATDGSHLPSGFATCVQVGASNDSWPTALDITTSGGNYTPSGPSGAPGYTVDAPGQSRWYKFQVTPGQQVTVNLSGLPVDDDLVVFKDISQAYSSLVTVEDLNKLGANFAGQAFSPQAFSAQAFSPQAFSPDAYSPQAFSGQAFSSDVFSPQAFSAQAFSGQAFSGQAFSAQAFSGQAFSGQAFSGQAFSAQAFSPQAFSSPDYSGQAFSPQAFSSISYSAQAFSGQAFSPQAFSSAQVQSLISVSAAPGTSPESITANTWNNTGYFYVRVSGKNGVAAPAQPFTLQVTRTGVSCSGVHDMGSAPPAAPASGYKTVILTDSTRIPSDKPADITTLNQQLAAFAARPEVAGVVVDVNSATAPGRIHDLVVQADNNLGCPYAQNLVATALKQIIDSYRPNNPLAYVVLVGGDSVIPFFRYPDDALLAPESGFIPPVLDGTASQASLQLNYVLSQDAYGAAVSVNQNVNSFPIADLAVGRVVETAAEATTMLNAYLSTTGGVVATPTSSLVTGYDFLSDAATSVKGSLDAGIGSSGQALIAPNNISPTDPQAWNSTQLKSALLGSRHDLVFLAGHFSANSALAADFSTTISTADLVGASTSFTNAIVFSAGCHSGYNIVNAHAIPNITQPVDWAEAFAQKGATLIAGTGYQYGDTDFEMYSEQIYAGFAAQLLQGSGPVSVGQALLLAKKAYLASTPTLRGIDTKALLESALFGLPMLSVNMPHGRTSAPADPSVVSNLVAATSGPGSQLGLKSTVLDVSDPLTQHTLQLKNPDGSGGPVATWYSGSAGVASKPFEPALPLDNKNVSVPGQSLRGVGFWAGTYTDTSGITPLTGAATEDLRGIHTPFQSSAFYPMRLANPNYFGSVTDASGTTRLLVTPAQHRADLTSASTSTLRLYSDLQLKLFYSDNVETRTVGGVTVTPALSAPPTILDVTAAPTMNGTAFTVSTHIIGDPSAGIQEVWVTSTANDGTWASVGLTRDPGDSSHWTTTISVPSGRSLADVRFMLQAANGVGLVALADNYGAYFSPIAPTAPNANTTTVTIAGTPTHAAYGTSVSFSATLAGAVNNGNQPITFTLGAMSKTSLTGSNGTASATFRLTSLPGTYPLSATFPGDAQDLPSTGSRSFTVDKVATTLNLAGPGQATPGASSGLVATLTDGNGLPVSLRTVWFVVAGVNGTTGGWTTTVTTDYLGRAALGVIPLPVGSYSVSAYFGGTITLLPTAYTTTLVDGTYLSSSASVPFSIIQVGTTTTLTVATTATNPVPQFSDTIKLGATVAPTVTGSAFSGTVQFRFGGTNVGSPIAVSNSSPAASINVTLDAVRIPLGAGAYLAEAIFTPSAGSPTTGSNASSSVAVQPEGQVTTGQLDGAARLDYTGDQFVFSGTAPTLSVVLRQGLDPETSDALPVDFSKVGVQVTFKLYPATCTTPRNKPTTCSPATSVGPVAVSNAANGSGAASVVAPASLPAGAYLVVASVTSGSVYIAPEVATATLDIAPLGITDISGGGYVNPDSTSNAPSRLGYFSFDTEKLSKSSLVGSMAYVYRVRINPASSSTTNLFACGSLLDASCRDVDVIIRSAGITALNGGQKGYATGTVAVNFVDAATGVDYTSLDYAGGTFRIDIVDNSQQGMPSQFGFTAYLGNGTTPFHQAFIPVGGGIAQTGVGVMTNETTVAGGFITSHP
jgi:hypothetical protein